MGSNYLFIEGGLIIGHGSQLRAGDLRNDLRRLFETHALDQAKYIVSDFSAITGIALEESQGRDIGALVRQLRSMRITLRRPFRWAAVTADQRVEHLAGNIALGAGAGINLKVFTNLHEALLWAKNPRAFMEIADFIARHACAPGSGHAGHDD